MSKFKPNAVFESVPKIDLGFLGRMGIRGILLDIDNTLIDMSQVLSDEIISWGKEAKADGFKVMILTNTNKKEKLLPISEKLGIEYVSFAKKPAKSGFIKAAKELQMDVSRVAMIGDQILTDIVGANRVGMFSIYVRPINEKEYWYTKWKRPIENWILKHYGY